MSTIYAWIKSVVACVLLLSLLQLLVPEKYERYVRLFTGIVLILVIVRPLSDLLADSGSLTARLRNLTFDSELALIQADASLYEGADMVKEQLQVLAGETVDQILAQYPAYKRKKLEIVCEANLESPDFGAVRRIRLWLSVQGQEREIKIGAIGDEEADDKLPAGLEVEKLRRELAACFEISPELIDIYG